MMNIYIVRHGIAEDSHAGGDARRELTGDGREKMKDVARGLARMGVKLECVFASPLVRARQTAEILAGEIAGGNVEIIDELAPGKTPLDVCAALQRLPEAGDVMLAGHQPNCSELVSYLIGGAAVDFKKGAVALVRAERAAAGRGELAWLIPPRAWRKAGA